jgi:hypothetical protein
LLGKSVSPAKFGSKTIKELVAGYRENFVKTCGRDPFDYKTFCGWPIYELKLRRQRRLEKLTVKGQGTCFYKRRLIAENVPFRFRDAERDRLEVLLCDLGILPGRKLVTLHVREGGFRRGREIQDKMKARGAEPDKILDDSTRNATIENYFTAIRYLTDAGYRIVRIGDPTMTPLSLASVVDIATLPRHDPALDYYCVSRSDFFVACDSGPLILS